MRRWVRLHVVGFWSYWLGRCWVCNRRRVACEFARRGWPSTGSR